MNLDKLFTWMVGVVIPFAIVGKLINLVSRKLQFAEESAVSYRRLFRFGGIY